MPLPKCAQTSLFCRWLACAPMTVVGPHFWAGTCSARKLSITISLVNENSDLWLSITGWWSEEWSVGRYPLLKITWNLKQLILNIASYLNHPWYIMKYKYYASKDDTFFCSCLAYKCQFKVQWSYTSSQ